METKDHNWDVCWAQSPSAEIDDLTLRIFREMSKAVSFRGRSVLELGCGTGRLSCLALRAGAAEATLVDSSPRAVAIARKLLEGTAARVVESDFRSLKPEPLYDIVFSSGVVEHFRGRQLAEVVELHRRFSRRAVLTVVPAGPHYNNLRMKKPGMVRLYGWQRPLTAAEMGSLFLAAGIRVTENRRFRPLYGIGRLERYPLLNRLLRPLDRLAGGLLLTAGTVADAL